MLGVLAIACIGPTGCVAGRRNRSADSNRSPTTSARSSPEGDTSAPESTGHTERSVRVDDTTRTYRLVVPDTVDRSTPVALVVMLHGGFGSARQAELAYGFDVIAEENRFVVAYPDATRRAWNAGDCCGEPARDDVDDAGFVKAMIDDIGTVVTLDPHRRFVAGMSNGAMMAERLACDTDLFAAVASVAGASMNPCPNPRPISVLHIHGLADTHVPFDGSPGNGIGRVPRHTPVAETIAMWRDVDGCDPATTTRAREVTTSTANCEDGRSVELITVDGAGHQWPRGAAASSAPRRRGADAPSDAFAATPLIWSFFAAHPSPT
ncbi:MAG: PHB depolymerase family esterase [Microthrixaceae bacterium]